MRDYAHEKADEKIAELESKLAYEYERAYREMEKKRREFMASFEEKKSSMEKRLKKGEITNKDYKQWLKGQSRQADWYSEMSKTLAADMNNVNSMAANMVNNELPEVYAENYNYGTYMVERGAKVDTSFTMVDRDTVYKLMDKKTVLLPYVKVDAKKDTKWNMQHFNASIAQSIIQGESIAHSAERLRRVVGMNYNASVRSARTAITAAENMGRQRSYERAEDMGIKLQKQWLATLDKRTRETHRMLDGETIPVKETFWNGCEYPGDPSGDPSEVINCRCTLITEIDGVDSGDLPRNSKLDDMTYDEWKESKDKQRTPKKSNVSSSSNITHAKLKEMGRSELISMAKDIFVKENTQNGLSKSEATKRFNSLVGSNTTPQLRKYIYNKKKR